MLKFSVDQTIKYAANARAPYHVHEGFHDGFLNALYFGKR